MSKSKKGTVIVDDDELAELVREAVREELAAALKQSAPEPVPLLDVKRAMKLLGVSRATLHRLTHEKGLPTYKVGDCLRYHPDEVLTWAKARAANELEVA